MSSASLATKNRAEMDRRIASALRRYTERNHLMFVPENAVLPSVAGPAQAAGMMATPELAAAQAASGVLSQAIDSSLRLGGAIVQAMTHPIVGIEQTKVKHTKTQTKTTIMRGNLTPATILFGAAALWLLSDGPSRIQAGAIGDVVQPWKLWEKYVSEGEKNLSWGSLVGSLPKFF